LLQPAAARKGGFVVLFPGVSAEDRLNPRLLPLTPLGSKASV
jgi:hypothetical protein